MMLGVEVELWYLIARLPDRFPIWMEINNFLIHVPIYNDVWLHAAGGV